MVNGNGTVERWVYRWIIAGLTGITMGAGTNYLTRLDRLTTVEVQLRVLNDKVDHIIDRQNKGR